MGELILQVGQETTEVMEMGGAGHCEHGLLVREIGEEVDVHGRAKLAELRDLDFVGSLELAQPVNHPGIEIAGRDVAFAPASVVLGLVEFGSDLVGPADGVLDDL